MANTPQFTMRLKPELREAVQRIADTERRSIGNVIELAIENFVRARKEAKRK